MRFYPAGEDYSELNREKLSVLQSASRITNESASKPLYEHTNAHIKQTREERMSALDKAYGQSTFLATEQDMQRSRGSPTRMSMQRDSMEPSIQGSPGPSDPDFCWTRVRTIIE